MGVAINLKLWPICEAHTGVAFSTGFIEWKGLL
jgi:hypothetical protein